MINQVKPVSEPLETLKQKRRVWLLPVLVLVVVAAGTIMVLWPQIQGIRTDLQLVKEETARLERLTEKRAALEGLSPEELDNQLLIVAKALPNEKPISQALAILLSRQTEPEIKLGNYALNPGEVATGAAVAGQTAEPGGVLAGMVMTTNLSGLYHQMVNWLGSLQDNTLPLARLVQVSLGLGAGPGERWEQPTTTDLDLDLMYAPPPETIGKVSDPLPVITEGQKAWLAKLSEREAASLDTSQLPAGIEENKANIFTF